MNHDVHDRLLPADVLFIHGNLSSNAWWRPSFEAWRAEADESFRGRAIAAEWKGCGKSEAPRDESELHPARLADDYINLLRDLGVKRAHVVGHSTGGLIALYAMAKAPELFDRAVLLDPVTDRGVAFGAEAIDAFAHMARSRDFCQTVMANTIHGVDQANPFFQQLVDDAFGVAPTVWTGIPAVLKTLDAAGLVDRIKQTTLVLHGELDPVLPIEGSVDLARRLKNGEFFELKGCGHSTNVEDPELFVRLVDEHLFETDRED